MPSFLQSLDTTPHTAQPARALKNSWPLHPIQPSLSNFSPSCEDSWVLEASVLFSGYQRPRSTSRNSAFIRAALLRSVRFQRKHKSGCSSNSTSASFCLLSLAFLPICLQLPSPVMESSQITGDDGEECNSNESGWTIYLASPTSSDDAKENGSEESNVEDGSGYINERRKGKEAHNADDDGDYDSLASDASTGTSQVKVLEGKEEKDRQTNESCSNDAKDEILTKFSTSGNKKAGKMKKGDDKNSKRGHNRRRSSSRTSFFW